MRLPLRFAVAFARPTESLARADSNAGAKTKPQLVRRHSSGDHAFLPSRQEAEAKLMAARGGVAKGDQPDSEVPSYRPDLRSTTRHAPHLVYAAHFTDAGLGKGRSQVCL